MPLMEIPIALVLIAVIAWLTNARLPVSSQAKQIVNVVLGLMVVGMFLWLVNTYVPMAGSIRGLLNIVVVVACCFWVLQAFGLWSEIVRIWHNLTTRGMRSERV